jgi:hypothetical protein
MFDFLTKEQQEVLNAIDNKDDIKGAIEKFYTDKSAKDIQEHNKKAVDDYKNEIETAKKLAQEAADKELAEVLKGENLINIKRLFVNISDEQGFIKELELRGLNKNAQTALLLSELGKRFEQTQRPAGTETDSNANKTMTSLQQLQSQQNK